MAVDTYGIGVRPKNVDEAGKLATKYKSNVKLLRSHIRAAYEQLAANPNVDPNKIIVMGYCFGGTTALELARSGVALAG
ncbi:dienelactone hydrolase family protein, partial [Helicobacter pylori]|uniref:dienelactone hydrolase family protein n=1 Tax=Helicobacter pylori TaxID=210 RepID=UPI002927A02E